MTETEQSVKEGTLWGVALIECEVGVMKGKEMGSKREQEPSQEQYMARHDYSTPVIIAKNTTNPLKRVLNRKKQARIYTKTIRIVLY